MTPDFAAIVARDGAVPKGEEWACCDDRRALIAMVREARWLAENAEDSYASKFGDTSLEMEWWKRRDAFLERTMEA